MTIEILVNGQPVPAMAGPGAETVSKPRIFHYARHYALLDWVRLGWIVAKPNCQGMYMDEFSVTVEWLCECKQVRPADR